MGDGRQEAGRCGDADLSLKTPACGWRHSGPPAGGPARRGHTARRAVSTVPSHLFLSKRGPSKKSPGGVTPTKPWGPNLVCGTSCWESLGSWIRPCCGSVSFGWR